MVCPSMPAPRTSLACMSFFQRSGMPPRHATPAPAACPPSGADSAPILPLLSSIIDSCLKVCSCITSWRLQRCRCTVAERDGLRRKLATQLSPEAASLAFSWDIADCIGMYWRPNHGDNSLFPYLPAHITRPKEVKKIFLVPLPERCYLAVIFSPRQQIPQITCSHMIPAHTADKDDTGCGVLILTQATCLSI